MKTAPRYYAGNPETVLAYQPVDLEKLGPELRFAEQLWNEEWIFQGAKDEGSCCGGKGIQVWFCGPRKRTAEPKTIIPAPPVQGNLSAQRSVGPALEYLKEQGIEARYYDGWMD
jgi:hypothetical protein